MIEFTLSCDKCGAIIVSSRKSPADARLMGRLQCSAIRDGSRDLCGRCRPGEVVVLVGRSLSDISSSGIV
jgi:hypothetical protein